MKKKRLAWTLALLLLSLTACGASGGDSADQAAPSVSETGSSDGVMYDYDYGWDANYDVDAPMEALEEDFIQSSGGILPADAKMIFSADLELETQDFDSAAQAIDQLTGELDGWFEVRRVNQGGSSRSLYCVIRVSAENFNIFLDQAGEAAHLVSREENGQDVSEAYYDNEARLTTQRTKLERLQTLLAQAETMEDIISLESAISETELQIEYLTGSLRHYDSLVGYSTINVSIWEVYRLSDDQEIPVTFGQRLSTALAAGFRSGVAGIEDFLIGLARNWMTLLIWVIVIAAAAALFRRFRRKRKKISMPPPSPPQSKE